MTAIPSDNHIWAMLDGAPTDHFDGVFSTILKDIDRSGGLKPFRQSGGRVLIALDGSEHFCSRNLSCPHCSTRKRSDGGTEYFRTFVGATLVAPGHETVLPLPPEFVRPQDGASKQDCEPMAAGRWLGRGGLPTISQGEKYGGVVTPPAPVEHGVLRVKARADARPLRG